MLEILSLEDELNMETRKEDTRGRFRSELGFLVDVQKPGCVMTNGGNTTRHIIFRTSILSSITGIYEEFIELLIKIRGAITRNYANIVVNFDNYARETASMYVR
jgi:hypothetical protein